MYLILHGTDLQSLYVVNRVNVFLAVGQVTESGFPDTQAIKLYTGKLIQKTLSDISHEYSVCLFCGSNQIRYVKCLEIADKVSDSRLVNHCNVDGTHLASFNGIDLSSKLSVMVSLYFVFAICCFVDPFCKQIHGLTDGSGL